MELEQKKQIIEQGKELIKQSVFPENILGSIKDSGLRSDIIKQIFTHKNIPRFENQTQDEKKYWKALFEVKDKYHDYLTAFLIFKNLSYLLIITGILASPSNIKHGLISLLLGIFIFIFSFLKPYIKKYVLVISIIFTTLLVLELVILGMPGKAISNLDNDILVRRGGLSKVFNSITPWFYLAVRGVVCAMLFNIYLKIKAYTKAKTEFEKAKFIDG